MSRLIAVGDIHGCDRALEALLDAIAPQPTDTLVTLGDYIDRGPNPRRVVERLLQLSDECRLRPILGNHEEMLLRVLDEQSSPLDWIPYGAPATLDSYGFAGDLSCISAEHVAFIRSCLPYFETDELFFTHANYDAATPLESQPAKLLRWTTLHEAPPEPHVSGRTAIVGHTADPDGQIRDWGHVICLDTFCYGGGWLSAMELPGGPIWQADQEGRLQRLARPAPAA